MMFISSNTLQQLATRLGEVRLGPPHMPPPGTRTHSDGLHASHNSQPSARDDAFQSTPVPTMTGSSSTGINGTTPSLAPASPTPNASTITAQSPSAMLNASTPIISNCQWHPPPPQAPPSADLDPNAFGINFSAGNGTFDPSFWNGETSLNFERDFAAWFDTESEREVRRVQAHSAAENAEAHRLWHCGAGVVATNDHGSPFRCRED